MGTGGSKQFNKARADERVTKLFNEVAGAADDAYKGEKKHITAADLMVRMEAHARAMGCEIVGDIITDLDTESRPFTAKGDSGATYTADAVILATGARAKWLGLALRDSMKASARPKPT